MLKIEYIWRELLFRAIEEHNPSFTITGLSQKFNLSTSVVSHALGPLRELNIVVIGKTRSKVTDVERFLLFWATRRNMKKDVIYQTFSSLPVMEIEASLPPDVYPTCYTAYRLYYDNPPADYQKVYCYAKNTDEVKKRFPEIHKHDGNIFILDQDPYLSLYKTTPMAQIFVDLWNMTDWYSKEFSESLLVKIRGRIGL